jgi:hypothetical protein
MNYRFPKWKDAPWNSYERQLARYETIRPFLGENSVGGEIGVYKGGFGEFLLPHCRKLYLVDPWYRAAPFWHSGLDGDSRVDTVIDILTKYRTEIHEGRVEVVVDYSTNFLARVPDETFDFLYIDASHRYEQTRNELALAGKKIKTGGVLLGDDYDSDPNSKQYGVFRAVNEFVEANKCELFLTSSRQWGIRTA